MEAAFAELPLALFTTLASAGAGAFIALAVAFATGKFADEQLKRIDKMTVVPVIVVIVGFICAAFHMASPAHMFSALAGIGTSPLTNEVLVGAAFVVVAIVYLVAALAGKLGTARKAFSAVVAIVAIVFALFMGIAYMIPTVPSWNNFLGPVEMVGFAFVGGAAWGALVLALAQATDREQLASYGKALGVVTIVGLVLGVGGWIVHMLMIAGIGNAIVSGSALLAGAAPCLVVGLILIVVAGALVILGTRKGVSAGYAAIATAVVTVGIFLARLSFYALYLSIGVTML